MARSEVELRRIAQHVNQRMPEEEEDRERVFEYVRELQAWEARGGHIGGDDDGGSKGCGGSSHKSTGTSAKVTRLKIPRKTTGPKLKIHRTAMPLQIYRAYRFNG